jgi:phosphatidylinositol phospholipase C delta
LKPSTPASLAAASTTNFLTPTSTGNSLAPSKIDNGDSGQSGSEDDRAVRSSSKKKKTKICESLSRLGVYTHSAHFTTFDAEDASHPPHVFSVSENEILELHQTHESELFAHNRKFFMRAYPSGRRIDSSNPDPSMFWRRGVQMVALNWQSWDEGTMVNEGMFAGEKGWVLKPPAFRGHDNTVEPVPIRRVTLDFRITVLAGQHIPLPIHHDEDDEFHPYVKCQLHVDKPSGTAVESGGRTKEGLWKFVTKHKKTDHPDWGPEGAVLNFVGVQNVIEDLCFLRLVYFRFWFPSLLGFTSGALTSTLLAVTEVCIKIRSQLSLNLPVLIGSCPVVPT